MEMGEYVRGDGAFNKENDRIGEYTFNAPDEEVPGVTSPEGALWLVARITLT
jgi:hypothetical protein